MPPPPEYDTIISGNLGSGQIGSVHMSDGALGSGNIGSGSVSQFALSSGAVNSGHVASGAVIGSLGAGAFTIASGTIGPNELGSGSILSGAIASGQIGINHLGSGSVRSGAIASGQIGPNHLGSGSVTSGAIASGQVGQSHIASGSVRGSLAAAPTQTASGTFGPNDLGSGSVLSGAIASGQVGQFHVASGAINSGQLNTTNAPDGTKFLRDDFAWTAVVATINSGDISSGEIASGAVQGFFGATRHIASGTVGVSDFGSGAVLSGAIASGQIGQNHIALNSIAASRIQATAIRSGALGSGAVIGQAGGGSFMIASGTIGANDLGSGAVVSGTIASGQVGRNHIGDTTIIATQMSSGSVLSGSIGSGQVGNLAIASGSVTSGRLGTTNVPDGTKFLRDDFAWTPVSAAVNSGDIGSGKVASGAVQGFFGTTRHIGSGTVGVFDLGSGAVIAGTVGSGAVASGSIAPNTIVSGTVAAGTIKGFIGLGGDNIASGTIGANDLGSGIVLSGAIASGQVGQFHVSSGAITSGRLGVTGAPDGTKVLRDDFTWVAPGAATVNSGDIGSGKIASGAVQGFFGSTRHIASGTIGVFDLGSGAVVAGTVGSGAIVSGNIGSGQVGGVAVAAIANLTNNGYLVTDGIISPTDTGTVDDWNPAGLTNATHVRCVNAAGSLTINGIAGGVNGRILTISAMSSNSVQLVNDAGTSTAANRISTNDADTVSLPALTGGATSGNTLILIYDGTISRWRVLAINSTYFAPPTAMANHLLMQAGIALSGVVAPASITGTNNNYTPGGDTFAAIINQDCTGNATITGMSMVQSTYAGKVVSLNNISTSFSITFTNEDAGSSAANRFTLANAAPLVIPPGGSVLLRYNTASSRWKPMADSTVIASGQVVAGTVGSGAVVSGSIASGVVGRFAIASGAVTSGRLGVTGVPDGTKVLRDDFTWAAPGTPTIGSGDIGSGKIASGAVQGFFGTTRHIGSGTVGVFDLGSGAVVAGTVGSGAVVSGNIASGQIGTFHHASGTIVTYARNVILDQYSTAEIVSGVRCVQFVLGASGAVRVAMATVSGRYPAIGVAFTNALSGQPIGIVRYGEVSGPSAQIGSGLAISGRPGGRSLWMGASGEIVTLSGGGPRIGVGATNSGAWGQRIGSTTSSGAVLIDPIPSVQFSGAANITTNPQQWPV